MHTEDVLREEYGIAPGAKVRILPRLQSTKADSI